MDVNRSPAEVLRDWRYFRDFGSRRVSIQLTGNRRVDLIASKLRGALQQQFSHEVSVDELPTPEGLQSLKEILAQRAKPTPQPNAPPETLPSPQTDMPLVSPSAPTVPPIATTPMAPTVLYEKALVRAVLAGLVVGIIIGVLWLIA